WWLGWGGWLGWGRGSDAGAAGAAADAALPAVHLRAQRVGTELPERDAGGQRQPDRQRPDPELTAADDVARLDELEHGRVDRQAGEHRGHPAHGDDEARQPAAVADDPGEQADGERGEERRPRRPEPERVDEVEQSRRDGADEHDEADVPRLGVGRHGPGPGDDGAAGDLDVAGRRVAEDVTDVQRDPQPAADVEDEADADDEADRVERHLEGLRRGG